MSDLSQAPYLDSKARPVRAPRGSQLSCANWQIEAPYRMIQNNLDREVAENPDQLVVYGGIGKAARNWPCFDAILDSLRKLQPDETLLIQSGKPVGIFRTHEGAPRVLIANSNLVPKWATWEHFNELDRAGLMMYGQMTAGSWIYIGTQGIEDGVEARPVACGPADPAIDHQVIRVFRNLAVQVVLDHAIGRFDLPVAADDFSAARGADLAGFVPT